MRFGYEQAQWPGATNKGLDNWKPLKQVLTFPHRAEPGESKRGKVAIVRGVF